MGIEGMSSAARPDRVLVAMTGATGAILGVRLLERLKEFDVERHLIVSSWGARTLLHETDLDLDDVRSMADVTYKITDLGAAVSSGSFITRGMIVVPCSVRTLAAIASGVTGDLISRAADVTLKERKPLILMVRESPLNMIHLENLIKVSRAGAHIVPPMIAFYGRPTTVDQLVDHIVTRALDQVGLHSDATPRWDGELGI